MLEQLDVLADTSRDGGAFAAQVAAHTRRLREEHFDFTDGHATERVFAEIQRRL